jgi:hypothetical protein
MAQATQPMALSINLSILRWKYPAMINRDYLFEAIFLGQFSANAHDLKVPNLLQIFVIMAFKV